MTIKEEFNKLDITFKDSNAESVTFFKKMGDLNDLDFRNKVEYIVMNSGNQELVTVFHRCRENANWLGLYDFLRKKS